MATSIVVNGLTYRVGQIIMAHSCTLETYKLSMVTSKPQVRCKYRIEELNDNTLWGIFLEGKNKYYGQHYIDRYWCLELILPCDDTASLIVDYLQNRISLENLRDSVASGTS